MSRLEALKSFLGKRGREQQPHRGGSNTSEVHPLQGTSSKTSQVHPKGEQQIASPPASRETTTSSAASELAGMFLEEQVRKGRTIEIPSLGIVFTKDKLRNPSKTD